MNDSAAGLVVEPVAGGSINETFRFQAGGKMLFCKRNSATKFPHLFSTEAMGLQCLAAQPVIRTPAIAACFEAGDEQVLLLEWINEGNRTGNFWKCFGEQLAALHRVAGPHFGLAYNNYMGSVPQSNKPHQLWTSFFWHERLWPMIGLCEAQGLLEATHRKQFESLQHRLPSIFEAEPPSLLHGDLWSGNFLCNEASQPVLIDPAVYFGHRSMDLGMTTLFGGFREPFYEAYHYHFSLPANHKEQWAVCNLYPLLIHLHLFGASYLPQIHLTVKQFS